MKRIITGFLLVSIAILASMSGCLESEEVGGHEYVDDLGNTISLNGTPEKVITLTPGLTEMVYYVEAGDKIVGCDSSSNHPDETQDIEKVSSWQGLDTEKILSLSPDLVLMDKNLDASGEKYDELKGIGLTVYMIYPKSINETMEVLRDLSRIMGTEEDSEEKIRSLEGRVDAVGESASGIDEEDRPLVLHVTYYEKGSDPWVMTDSTFSGDLIETAGGIPSVEDPKGLAIQISVERMLELDPDMILTSQSSLWPTTSREDILSDEAMEGLSAAENRRVYDVEGDWMDRTGPRMVDGLEAVQGHINDFVEEA